MEYQTVLITGASSGFGEATARLLAQKGYKLVLVARRKQKLEELKKELRTDVHIQQADITDKKQVEFLWNNLPEQFRNVDILINNAGLAIGMDLAHEAQIQDWEQMIQTNIKGVVYCTHTALKGMKSRNSGLIITIGSVAGTVPYPRGNVYGATKAFVKQFSRNLRADLVGTNIKVSNIEPGAAETEFSLIRFKGDSEKAAKVYENARTLQADDIARTIHWIIDQPQRVNIDTIEIMPIDNTFAGLVMHRQK